jgi:hypothetical protein
VNDRIAPFSGASPMTRSQLAPFSRSRDAGVEGVLVLGDGQRSRPDSQSMAAPSPIASRIGGVPASKRCGGSA